MNLGNLTFTVSITNSDGTTTLFETTEAGSLAQSAEPLTVAKEMSATVWAIVDSYAASLDA